MNVKVLNDLLHKVSSSYCQRIHEIKRLNIGVLRPTLPRLEVSNGPCALC